MENTLRYLAPRDHDRVVELITKYPCDISKLSNQLQVIKLLKDVKKYKNKNKLFLMNKIIIS